MKLWHVGLAMGSTFLIGMLLAWFMGGAERDEQRHLRRLRESATVADWQLFRASNPDSHEAGAWVGHFETQAVQPEAEAKAVSKTGPQPPSRESQLRAEIAKLEARFTVLYQQAAAAKTAEQEKTARTPAVRAPVAPLPVAPDAAAVDAYLLAVQSRLAPVTSYRDGDEDVALIRVVPAAHVNLLLEAAVATRVSVFRFLVGRALPDMVTPDQQDLILTWLPKLPELIAVVERRGWQTQAMPIMRTGIATVRDMGIQVEWMRLLATAADPADYDLMQKTILANPYGYWRRDLCREVERLPGFPIRETVERCWAENRTTNGASAFLPVAAEYGSYDALTRIVACLDQREQHLTSEAAGTWLDAHTDMPGDPPSRLLWLGTATDMPTFDLATHRWSRKLPTASDF